MAIASKQFFMVTIWIYCVRNVQNDCYVGWNGEVDCIAVDRVSIMLLSQLEGIYETKTITIKHGPELKVLSGAFRSAHKVNQIVLSNNTIRKISKGAFVNIPVRHLFINFNEIDEIETGAFSNLSSLEVIAFEGNNYPEIPTGLFANLPISWLALNSNGISTMEDMVLRDLPNLKYLSLYDNKLRWIFLLEVLTYPQRLQVLHLHNNNLTIISNYMLLQLRGLKELNLGNNFIHHIEPRSFAQTPLLEHLDLSGNHLKVIDENVFPAIGMENLEELYLHHNRLMYLTSKFFLGVGYLRKISIFGNPWWCSCFTDMQRMLAEEGVTTYNYEEYLTGKRPVCISAKIRDTECKKSYDNFLSEKYIRSLIVML